MTRINEAKTSAQEIAQARYPDAALVLLAGSVVRGQDTIHSDLDLVVIYHQLPQARRESFRFAGWPVEAFINDPETLAYFAEELDLKSAEPIMLTMISEGILIAGDAQLAQTLKARADQWLKRGPAVLSAAEIDRLRYVLTDTLDDIRAPKSREQLMASGCVLYRQVADCFFRTRGTWCARGKSIPRKMQEADAGFAREFQVAFDELFQGHGAKAVLLVETLLAPLGGTLFEGYQLEAPVSFRKKLD
jgi:hypothetical protein